MTPIMENQIETERGHEMETVLLWEFLGLQIGKPE